MWLRSALPSIGFELDVNRVDALAYADDLVLFAERLERLQEKLDVLTGALKVRGMALNIKNSVGLTIARDGKTKCMVLVPWVFRTEGVTIPPMG